MLGFRAAALKRQQSPNRLDELLQTTTSRNKWALAALGVLLGTALLWSIFGSVPTTVSSEGILIRDKGICNLSAQGEGTVLDVLVQPGETVKNNQIVARVTQPQLEAEARGAKAEAERLRQDYEHQAQRYKDDDKLYAATVASERTDIAQTLKAREKRQQAIQEGGKVSGRAGRTEEATAGPAQRPRNSVDQRPRRLQEGREPPHHWGDQRNRAAPRKPQPG